MLAASKKETPDLQEIEAFLYRETDFLDAGNLHGWCDLFTEDGTYWLPKTAPTGYLYHRTRMTRWVTFPSFTKTR